MDKNGNQIIAVDFDGTIVENAWPQIGAANPDLIQYLLDQKAAGARLILWTNRAGKHLEEAVSFCKEFGLEFEAVNENLPELIEWYGNDPRKVSADIYIDDKSVNPIRHRQAAGLYTYNIYQNPIDARNSADKDSWIFTANDVPPSGEVVQICTHDGMVTCGIYYDLEETWYTGWEISRALKYAHKGDIKAWRRLSDPPA